MRIVAVLMAVAVLVVVVAVRFVVRVVAVAVVVDPTVDVRLVWWGVRCVVLLGASHVAAFCRFILDDGLWVVTQLLTNCHR